MSAFDAYIRLDGAISGSIVCDEPMSRHTTYRIGGPAALYITCDTVSDLSLVTEVLAEEGIDWTVVGKGSNLLVADAGYDGAVIVLGREFGRIDFGGYGDAHGTDASQGHAADEEPCDAGSMAAEEPAEVLVTVGAACVLSRLVTKAFGLGLEGLGFAVGTPGTVGGAVRMNAGTASDWFSSVIESVTVFTPGKGLSKIPAQDIEWGYRTSSLDADAIVVEVALILHPSDKIVLHASMEANLRRRRATQPLSKPSCGSVFRGAAGRSAGELIESCGLKGTACGDAQISDVHANFIVNNGNATARDVASLIKLAQDKVREKHGIELQPEVRFLGF